MLKIRKFERADFSSVQAIYQQGIDTGHATFQLAAKDWDEWNCSLLESCRLVAVFEDKVVGWAALSPVSSRSVYSGVAEVSLYVSSDMRGQQVGTSLLSELITISEQHGIWTLQAGIFPENEGSIHVHKKNGFKLVGVREKLGKLNNKWRDVALLERRSAIVDFV
ncbi:GNAT family N-acetyltransferase [Vibrio sp. SCSIO 43137]|uniref:GNAT family N-acetyltransferase n=1 Tax=Vibrio sp. SCSIO 43137 TaxID=3021011 RepID=UPI002306FFD0|nr:GNAT family N-acetyltransferase [Vibrio sp. SCSIO 43137]WCE31896.1 GNAT family N-acetyltransferase [Vibrio sp. SCSIO 43137]